MATITQDDTYRYRIYLEENAGWRKLLDLQSRELKELEKLLADIVYDPGKITGEDIRKTIAYFRDSFNLQAKEISRLCQEIAEQQKRLAADCHDHAGYDIDSICAQDILREQVRSAEQRSADLKNNFMTYLSSHYNYELQCRKHG